MINKWEKLSKILLIIVFGLTISFIQPLVANSSQIEESITIAGGSTGGTYMVMSGGLASYLTNNIEGCTVSGRLTGGSVENARLLETHQVDLGFLNAAIAYQKAKGLNLFEGEASGNLRFVALDTLSAFQWVTLANSGIKTMRDLEGKRVSTGPAGGGTAEFADYVFKLYGLTDKIKIVNLGFSESAQNLKDKAIDAFLIGSSVPNPAIVDVASLREIYIIPIDEEIFDSIVKESPYYSKYILPANVYRGVEEPTTIVGVGTVILANKEVSKERIYEITKLILGEEAQEYMRSVYSSYQISPGIDLANMTGIPLHPGAEQYYKEEGMLK